MTRNWLIVITSMVLSLASAKAISIETLEFLVSSRIEVRAGGKEPAHVAGALAYQGFYDGFFDGTWNSRAIASPGEEEYRMFFPDMWMADPDKVAKSLHAFIRKHAPQDKTQDAAGITAAWFLWNSKDAGAFEKRGAHLLMENQFGKNYPGSAQLKEEVAKLEKKDSEGGKKPAKR